jgi:N-acetylneuraminate lyase
MTKPLAGMYAALLSGLADDGAFSPDRQRAIDAFVLRQGLTGLYVGGSSGESGLLDAPALLAQQEVVAASARGTDARLIAHVGMPSLSDSVRLARNAARLGYHGLSALPPHSYPFSDAEILGYYRALASATDLPMIVYEVPIRTGRPLPLALLLDLLDLPGVAGIKFTSTDLFKFAQLIRRRPHRTYFFGFDEIWLAGGVGGADGGIGTTYNLLGKLYAAIAAARSAGDLPRAMDLQAVAAGFVDDLLPAGVLPGMKAALRVLGVDCGPTRLPMASGLTDPEAHMARVLSDARLRPWLPAPHSSS